MGPPTDRVLKNTLTDGSGNMSIDGLATLIKSLHAETDKKLVDFVKIFDAKIEKFNDSLEKKCNNLANEVDKKFNILESKTSLDLNQTKIECNAKLDVLEARIADRFNEMDRCAIQNDLVVHGIPSLQNENVGEIVLKIMDKFGLDSSLVIGAFRLRKINSAKFVPPIILKCSSAQSKMKILGKYFEFKTLNLRDVGFDVSTRIFVNESLTKNDLMVKQYALKLQKEGKVYKVSVRNCEVIVKMKQDSAFRKVKMCELTLL